MLPADTATARSTTTPSGSQRESRSLRVRPSASWRPMSGAPREQAGPFPKARHVDDLEPPPASGAQNAILLQPAQLADKHLAHRSQLLGHMGLRAAERDDPAGRH